MGHLTDKPDRGVARQPRVGVERDHVANTGRQGGVTFAADKGRIVGAAQKLVELVQLAALALPPHPLAFALVENAASMQMEKAVPCRTIMALVQIPDRVVRKRQKFGVAFDGFRIGVEAIGEKHEGEIAARAGEVVNLELFDLL